MAKKLLLKRCVKRNFLSPVIITTLQKGKYCIKWYFQKYFTFSHLKRPVYLIFPKHKFFPLTIPGPQTESLMKMESKKTIEYASITNSHGVKISRVNLKENPSSKKYRVSRSKNKTDDNNVIQDVVPLRMIVAVDISTTKSKEIGLKKKKASKMVSPFKIKPYDPFVVEKFVGKDHRDRTETIAGEFV